MMRAKAARLPRRSHRWYLAMVRLVAARLWSKLGPRELSRAFFMIALALGVSTVNDVLSLAAARHASQPVQQAIGPIVIQLILFAVSLLVSWALTPKQKDPEKTKATAPQVEDGQGMDIICGTVWVEDEAVLAFKELTPKKIYAKGGKK